MPTLNELRMLIDQPDAARLAAWVVGFAAWSLAIWAIAQAVFRSWPAQSLQKWLWTDEAKAGTLRRFAWEIQHAMQYDEDLARGQQLRQGIPLSPEEVEARRQKYLELARVALPKRILSYLLSCAFCQHFWVTVMLTGWLGRTSGLLSDLLPTALAYIGLIAFIVPPSSPTPDQRQQPGGCANRGCEGR